MAFAEFVSETYIKTITPADFNLDVTKIRPYIALAQDKHMQDLLGSKFYQHLMDAIIIDPVGFTGLTSDELYLLAKIKPCVGWYTMFEAIPFISTKIDNIGITQTNGTLMTNADMSKEKYLMQKVLDNAEFYKRRISDYLCYNAKLFPQYLSINPTEGGMYPHTSDYSCGVAFDEDCIDYVDLKFLRRYIS